MKETERSEIISAIENDADLENAEEYRRVAEIRIRLDNNRQLTRIADQGEPTRIVFATKVTKEDSIKCLDCDFIASETEFQILDKRGDYLKCPKCGAKDDRLFSPEPTTPSPDVPTDALVEAVKRFIDRAEAVVDENMIVCDYDISVSSVKCLKDALAAYVHTSIRTPVGADGRMTEKGGA